MLFSVEPSWYDENGTLQTIKSAVLEMFYPVGSIYMSTSPANPSTFMGGTWVQWGQGMVPVGVNSDDSDFNTVEKTGGEKATTLTVDQMPRHNHAGTSTTSSNRYATGGQTVADEITSTITTAEVDYTVKSSTTSKYHVGTTAPYVYETVMTTTSEYGVCASGGGQSHNNLQPYITCYMWKRTS